MASPMEGPIHIWPAHPCLSGEVTDNTASALSLPQSLGQAPNAPGQSTCSCALESRDDSPTRQLSASAQQPFLLHRVCSAGPTQRSSLRLAGHPGTLLLCNPGPHSGPCPRAGVFVAGTPSQHPKVCWPLGTSGNPYWAWDFPKCFLRGPCSSVGCSKVSCRKRTLWSSKSGNLGRKVC